MMLIAGMILIADAQLFWPERPWLMSSLAVLSLEATALAYGRIVGNRYFYVAAAGLLLAWSTDLLVRGYYLLQPYVIGLKQISWGAAFFLLAIVISLLKTRIFAEHLVFRRKA